MADDYVKADFKDGDWICMCGMHNFRRRLVCAKCGKKDDGLGDKGQSRGGYKQEKPKKPKHLKRKLELAKQLSEDGAQGNGVAQALMSKLEAKSKDLEDIKAAKAIAWKELCQKLTKKQGKEWEGGVSDKFEQLLKSGCSKANFLKALGISEDDMEKAKDKDKDGNAAAENDKIKRSNNKDRPNQGARKRKRDAIEVKKEAAKAAKAESGEKKENPAKIARREARAVKQEAYKSNQD